MSFLYPKNYLFFKVKNVIARFLKSDIHVYNKSIKKAGNSVYESTIINYYDKLQILEEKLETADKIQANIHKTVVRKTAEKIDQLRKTICDEKSDLYIVGSVAAGLTISKDSDVDLVFVSLNHESNGSLICSRKESKKVMRTMGKLIMNDKKLWNIRRDRLSYNFTTAISKMKLNFGDGTKFNIKYNDYHSLRRTNLLRYYASSDPRYRKVYMYINGLASKLNILDEFNRLLTNYQISVLVAHFLQKPFKDELPVLPVIPQVCSPFVSPNLPIKEVMENLNKPVDVRRVQFLTNPNPLASHLAIQFIDYFAEFDFLSKAIFLDKIDPIEMIQADSTPKLQLFDPYSDKSISRSHCALEAFSESMKYVQNLIIDGYCIDDFSNLPNIKEFKKKLRKILLISK